MIDVAHHGHDRRTHLQLFRFGLDALQVVLDLIFLEQLGAVAQLFDHQHRGVALDRLIDRRHDAQVHQHLDHLGRLDRHLLRQLGHRDGLAERHLALDRRGGHLEAVLGFGAGPRPCGP